MTQLLPYLLILLGVALLVFVSHRLGRPKATPTPFADTPVQLTKVGEWQFRYHQSGSGPYMVLLHGIGANLFCWRWLIPFLSGRHTVVALDLPGFGQSTGPEDAHFGLDEQVERLRAFFAYNGISRPYLVGNSMGANIALWYALNYPDDCRGCAVIAPATDAKLIPFRPWAWLAHPASLFIGPTVIAWAHRRTVSRKDRVDANRIEESYRTYGGNAAAIRRFFAAMESVRDQRLVKRLPDLKTPVLVLWGEEDQIVPRQVIKGLESALAAKETHIHPGGGHHLQEDFPEWVSEKIDAFFAKQPD